MCHHRHLSHTCCCLSQICRLNLTASVCELACFESDHEYQYIKCDKIMFIYFRCLLVMILKQATLMMRGDEHYVAGSSDESSDESSDCDMNYGLFKNINSHLKISPPTESPSNNVSCSRPASNSIQHDNCDGETLSVQAASMINGKCVWDKKQYCLYCQVAKFNLPRHLELVHAEEPEVKDMLSYDIGSAERLHILQRLENRGNHYHNYNVLSAGKEVIVPYRRPSAPGCSVYYYNQVICNVSL